MHADVIRRSRVSPGIHSKNSGEKITAEKQKRLHAARRLRAQRILNTFQEGHLRTDNWTLHASNMYAAEFAIGGADRVRQ